MNLETAVERTPGCVPRGVLQRTGRRNSRLITKTCNASTRRVGPLPGIIAVFTQLVSGNTAQAVSQFRHLCDAQSGQPPFLG
jgi:hypothetical protein